MPNFLIMVKPPPMLVPVKHILRRHSSQLVAAMVVLLIPVVVEGLLKNGRVEGTNVEVKHSEEYEADNPDRVDDDEPVACSQQA